MAHSTIISEKGDNSLINVHNIGLYQIELATNTGICFGCTEKREVYCRPYHCDLLFRKENYLKNVVECRLGGSLILGYSSSKLLVDKCA